MHPWFKDLAGLTFGKWFVVRRDTAKQGRKTLWICRCECGVEKSVPTHNLTGNKSTRCLPCSRRKATGDLPHNLWHKIEVSASSRKLLLEITKEDALEQFLRQKGRCALTNLPLQFGDNRTKRTASLDRIDSRFGYIPGNIQWVHVHVNMMKQDDDEDDFISMCRLIAAHRGAK